MRPSRTLVTAVSALLLAAGGLAVTTAPAQAAITDIRVNEAESSTGNGGSDWAELVNPTVADVNIGGLVIRDSGNNTATVPAGTILAAGQVAAFDISGLGDGDSVRIFTDSGAAQPFDTLSWTFEAVNTWGLCPGQGVVQTVKPTRGETNTCAAPITAGAWPGGSTVTAATEPGLLSPDTSGLAYEASGTSAPGTMWAVRNNPGTLDKLVKTGSTWVRAGGAFATGRELRYADGTPSPDTEGITITDRGSAAGVFAITERDNDTTTVSKPQILRFDPAAPGATLSAAQEWNLNLGSIAPNSGPEGIAFVPDAVLVAQGLRDLSGPARPYDPTTYPAHFGGLFFIGTEEGAEVQAYLLAEQSGFTRVINGASSGFTSVAELSYEAETQKLWVVCDDNCAGRSTRFGIDPATRDPAPGPYYERPTTMPNLNNEGFTTTPQAECVGGRKPVYWTDDERREGGIVLRQGSLSCTPLPSTPGTTTPTPPAPAADKVLPVVKITGVKAGKTYPRKKKARCVATDASGIRSCTLKTTKKKAGTLTRYAVTATAVDNAGNTATTKVTYKVGKKRKR